VQHRVAIRFSRESGCMHASVLGPASVDGVCGVSLARGNYTIVVTRGYRILKSGDDGE